jgi:hypothetical protein
MKKAKAIIFGFVAIIITGIVLKAVTNMIGVEITGPPLSLFLFGLVSGFAVIAIWEFFGSVFK